jgi:hypothetical protein
MSRCAAGGNSDAVCSCMYDKVKHHYSSEYMKHLGDNGWFPDDFADVSAQSAKQCGVNP